MLEQSKKGSKGVKLKSVAVSKLRYKTEGKDGKTGLCWDTGKEDREVCGHIPLSQVKN